MMKDIAWEIMVYYLSFWTVYHEDLLFCFAYNCKNTVKFNNHIASFFSLFCRLLKKCLMCIVQILNRTWHNNNNLNVHFNIGQ